MKGSSDFKSDMMACSCDVVKNFIVITCCCYWLGESTYILGNFKRNFVLGKVHYLLGNYITKPTKQILPLSIPFVSPYDNTSFVCICGGGILLLMVEFQLCNVSESMEIPILLLTEFLHNLGSPLLD
jgi:hypothetical protein